MDQHCRRMYTQGVMAKDETCVVLAIFRVGITLSKVYVYTKSFMISSYLFFLSFQDTISWHLIKILNKIVLV